MSEPIRVLVSVGTRPEAIKLAPVIRTLRGQRRFRVSVLATAQHREMLDDVLDVFQIRPDYDLDIMRHRQSLTDVTIRAMSGLGRIIDDLQPRLLVVQGDTTTAFACALVAFYRQVRVAHVEAGLRTFDKFAPFPEEMNRRLISALADFHFAPTPQARTNLLAEGVNRRRIWLTGNTVVDALRYISRQRQCRLPSALRGIRADARIVLVTAHRRENFGPGLDGICQALLELARTRQDITIVYPVHPNPNVQQPVRRLLARQPRILLLPPQSYPSFVALLRRSWLILTDSGGIQEEATVLGKPVLVLRDKTERPEAVAAGVARVVGTRPQAVVAAATRLLATGKADKVRLLHKSPFGDGRAAERIAAILLRELR